MDEPCGRPTPSARAMYTLGELARIAPVKLVAKAARARALGVSVEALDARDGPILARRNQGV